MATFAGATAIGIRADVFGFFPGRTAGFGIPFHPFHFPFVDKVPVESLSGTITPGPAKSGTKLIATYAGNADNKTTFADIWFDRVHALPRTKFEFGNIITLIEDEYEIYSAYRTADTTLTTIVNNALPGIELPGISAPLLVPHLTSILDATTTDNSGGTGLGTIVKTKIQATADGLPRFDTTIDFTFSTGDAPKLYVSGQRIVLIPTEYEAPVKETLAFLTDIIESMNGKEQRIALRSNPRQIFEVLYRVSDVERQAMQAMLMDWQSKSFGFPLWHEYVETTAAVTAGATSYPISGGDDSDFRVGGTAVIITDANTFDVITIQAKTDTTITAASGSTNAYPAGSTIMPLRTAIIQRAISGGQHLNGLEDFKVTFQVTDNDTGAPTGDTTPGTWSIYGSRVLFDDCNVSDGTMTESYFRRVYRVDNHTGVVTQDASWDKNKRSADKGFVAHSRAEIMKLRKLILALRGKQKSFWIPTFMDDVTPNAVMNAGTLTLDIENIGYSRFVKERNPKKVLRISFTNGDPDIVRIVQSSVQVSSTMERLTLDTNWPSTYQIADIYRMQFYELVRFNSDMINFNYTRIGLAKVTVPVRTVFDE